MRDKKQRRPDEPLALALLCRMLQSQDEPQQEPAGH